MESILDDAITIYGLLSICVATGLPYEFRFLRGAMLLAAPTRAPVWSLKVMAHSRGKADLDASGKYVRVKIAQSQHLPKFVDFRASPVHMICTDVALPTVRAVSLTELDLSFFVLAPVTSRGYMSEDLGFTTTHLVDDGMNDIVIELAKGAMIGSLLI